MSVNLTCLFLSCCHFNSLLCVDKSALRGHFHCLSSLALKWVQTGSSERLLVPLFKDSWWLMTGWFEAGAADTWWRELEFETGAIISAKNCTVTWFLTHFSADLFRGCHSWCNQHRSHTGDGVKMSCPSFNSDRFTCNLWAASQELKDPVTTLSLS